jgi:predicted ribosome quality control (RQC) complex YloA/Tae2 family protein
MDGLMLAAVVSECGVLLNGKIEKIYQPEKDELLLSVRNDGQTYKLLISASPNNFRLQLTEAKRTNPADAPMFCMMLRKYILGGRILSIEQPERDRIVILSILGQNQFGDQLNYKLIAEIMGKHSNIVFADENNIILDAIRHVGPQLSSVRQVMPGITYVPPPAQEKLDPFVASAADFEKALSMDGRIDKVLSGAFYGLAPNVAAQLTALSTHAQRTDMLTGDERVKLSQHLATFYSGAAKGIFRPTIITDDYGDAAGIFAFSPNLPGSYKKEYASASAALDEYYEMRDREERMKRKSASLVKILKNNVERCYKKLQIQNDIILEHDGIDQYRLYGELLMANIYQIKRGKLAVVENYYTNPPEKIAIALDDTMSPSDNAQRYFKKYQKAKQAYITAMANREKNLEEIAYLEGQMDNVLKCSEEAELLELNAELVEQGYIKRIERKKQIKLPPSKPMQFLSDDDFTILVGKNNRQNDQLTLKLAQGTDIWLHTKQIPGSHVIIKTDDKPVSKSALEQAALLAAYYSAARASESVPVDYTQRKFVKKPAGSRPGMVIYTTNKTVYVTPNEALVRKIRHIQ